MNEHDDLSVNPTGRPTLPELDAVGGVRRQVLRGGLGAALGPLFGARAGGVALAATAGLAAGGAQPAAQLLGFASVPPSTRDAVVLPPGHAHQVVIAWGDPIDGVAPRFAADASDDAQAQARQWGQHNDGMHFFALPRGTAGSTRGLLVSNFEYADPGLMAPDGFSEATLTLERVRKVQNAHGVGIVEIVLEGDRWRVVPSPFARRITALTPTEVSGPAAGHPRLRTAADPGGRRVLGTLNNCAMGVTPWGTYLTCEENFNGYFGTAERAFDGARDASMRRYGVNARGFGYQWHRVDERFDVARHPNEPNRFGWIVEIDPWDPSSVPRKRTALGRFKHEGAACTVAPDGRVVIYSGDDQVNEYLYKFVSARSWNRADPSANAALLDEGTLYVARFEPDGRGRWLPLVHGRGGLDAAAGFGDQGDVLIDARRAADVVGATPMDRPEWIAVHPATGEVYATMTNNATRGTERGAPVDAANPRRDNRFGHIVRWREAGGDAAASAFEWDLFVLAGNPAAAAPEHRGNVRGDAFGSPDGLWFDADGRLWIQTDVSTNTIGTGLYEGLGNNAMLAADVRSGEIRRFLVGPPGAEITGAVATPDQRWMFVNVQHPGETAGEGPNRPDPASWRSHWPDGGSARPRSATIAIRRLDGGKVGA